jgi:Zn-dependent protease with chaperone function
MSASQHLTPNDAERRARVYAAQRTKNLGFFSQRIAHSFADGTGVRMANPDNEQERRLIDHVIDACDFHGIKKIPPVAIVSSHKVNAASVNGKCFVFTSEMVKQFPNNQIRAVVGHELSHHVHHTRDLAAQIGIFIAGSAALILSGLSPVNRAWERYSLRTLHGKLAVATATLVESSILGVFLTPWRWHMERESDREGARFTSPDAMAGALTSLKNLNDQTHLSVREPGFWGSVTHYAKKTVTFLLLPFGTHPPIESRIAEMHERASKERPCFSTAELSPKTKEITPFTHIRTGQAQLQNTLENSPAALRQT